jgi:iron complex transport system ATP-binding protein
MPDQPAIELHGVTVKRSARSILRHITWTVPAGRCAAILGPNGSGKSTLARVIMGQMWPTSGTVRVLGAEFGQTDLNKLRESIRLVQSNGVVEIDPEQPTADVVLTGFFGTVGLYDPVTATMRKRASQLLSQVGLSRQAKQPYRTLSSGERMRCLIARALAVRPRLLILDEPTAGLDVLAREQVLATVQQLASTGSGGPTVLMITHHVEELLPQTSAVLLLKNGATAASGAPAKVLRSAVLSAAYNFPVKVTRHGGRFWLSVNSHAWKNLTTLPARSAAPARSADPP